MADICYISTEMKSSFDLLLISPEKDIVGEAKTVSKLFSHGLEIFHLRKPHWNVEQAQRYLESIPKEFHNKIVLHSHFQLTDRFGLKGIHLNEENKKLIEQFRSYKIISASFHSLPDLKENNFSYQYVFLSPIYNSISKTGYNSNFDLKLLTEDITKLKRENNSLPSIIALGGIDAGNIMKVKEAGFSGAAFLGAVWESKNPVETFLKIKSIVTLSF